VRILLILCALAGAAFSGLLLRMSAPQSGPVTLFGSPVCAASRQVNCDYVLASRWAKIGPLPAAGLGLAYFSALAVWYIAVGIPNYPGRRWHLVPLGLTGLGALGSAFFVFVMAAWLPVWCTWCLAVHAVNGVMLVLGVLAWPRRPRIADSAPAALPSTARAVGVLSGCVAFGFLGLSAIFSYQMQVVARKFQLEHLKATNNADYILWRFSQSAARDVPIAADDYVIGRAGAANTLVVFTDFECVNCAGFHRYAARLANLFPDAIRIVFKHFPLGRDCNPNLESGPHFFACEAATAAEAARRVAGQREVYLYDQKLFENARRLDRRPYEALVGQAGIDVEKWRQEMASSEVASKIAADVALGHELGVVGTPTIFLNGRRLEAWHLLTSDAQPQVDLAATDQLWERLLGVKSQPVSTRTAGNS
jgi:uncharacterized membrane protein/protein-disulfide isomerase